MARVRAVAILLLRADVALHAQGIAADLGQDVRPFFLREKAQLEEIIVDAYQVAALLVKPAARLVDDAGRVLSAGDAGQAVGVKLAPTLVENHPDSDARMILQKTDRLDHLRFKLLTAGLVRAGKERAQAV